MDHQGQGPRPRSAASSALVWCSAETATRAAGPIARPVGTRGGSVRLPWASLDRRASRSGDQARIWRELSSDPLFSPPQGHQAQSAETRNAGDPTERASHPGVARPPCA